MVMIILKMTIKIIVTMIVMFLMIMMILGLGVGHLKDVEGWRRGGDGGGWQGGGLGKDWADYGVSPFYNFNRKFWKNIRELNWIGLVW